MDFKNKFITWSNLEILSIQKIKEYIKVFQAKPDPFVLHNPSFIIINDNLYENFEKYDLTKLSYRLQTITSDTVLVSESDFIKETLKIKPKDLLTDCLKPKTLEDVIGHKTIIETIEEWFESSSWLKSKELDEPERLQSNLSGESINCLIQYISLFVILLSASLRKI